MNYYLVKGTVTESHYMGRVETFDDTRLVMAENMAEAEQKFEAYWDSRSQEYSVYYYASGHAQETIL